MLTVSGLTAGYSGHDIFTNISFQIKEKERVGLIGKNGAGKSTLLKIIAGIQPHQSGGLVFQPGTEVGYLPQEIKIEGNKPIFQEALKAFDRILAMQREIKSIEQQLETRTDYESESYMNLIARLSELHEKLQVLDSSEMESKTEKVLKGLGFRSHEFSRPITEFSGGWQMRVELAKILLQMPELILLDEPTNHLDIESIMWLENFFSNYPGGILMVSHDKMFLDNVTNKTIEIVNKKVYDYKAPYSKFLQIREERIEMQKAQKKNQDQYIKQQERFIERFRAKNTKAKQVQSKLKQLDKIERVEVDDVESSQINITFPPAPRAGDRVIQVKDLGKAYGSHNVFQHVNFEIRRGEKVAFVGKNGAGKTTLVKIINGMKPTSGEYIKGHNVEKGYYAQIQESTLNEEDTVFDTLDKIATDEWRNVSRLRGLLGAFLFGEEDIDKKVKVLSGGEKSRLALAKLLLKPYNLLVLDEPTNHLDITSKEVLKNALNQYNGTLIVVSHDREFLQDLTDKTYEFVEGTVKEHLGSIDEFLDKKKAEHFRAFETEKDLQPSQSTKKEVPQKLHTPSKQEYQQRKALEKEERLLHKEINKLERKIETLETSLAELEEKLADPTLIEDVESSKEFFFKHGEVKKQLDQYMARWEKNEERRSELQDKIASLK